MDSQAFFEAVDAQGSQPTPVLSSMNIQSNTDRQDFILDLAMPKQG